jgi:hypothetical protein
VVCYHQHQLHMAAPSQSQGMVHVGILLQWQWLLCSMAWGFGGASVLLLLLLLPCGTLLCYMVVWRPCAVVVGLFACSQSPWAFKCEGRGMPVSHLLLHSVGHRSLTASFSCSHAAMAAEYSGSGLWRPTSAVLLPGVHERSNLCASPCGACQGCSVTTTRGVCLLQPKCAELQQCVHPLPIPSTCDKSLPTVLAAPDQRPQTSEAQVVWQVIGRPFLQPALLGRLSLL